jgi:hypothetical protein
LYSFGEHLVIQKAAAAKRLIEKGCLFGS